MVVISVVGKLEGRYSGSASYCSCIIATLKYVVVKVISTFYKVQLAVVCIIISETVLYLFENAQ
jgi:hypothetical protein